MDPSVLLIVGMCAVIYFLMLRPQQKRERERRDLVRSLAEGDDIVTNAGIHGVIVEVEKDVVWLEVAPGVELKIARDAVVRRASRSSSESDDSKANGQSKSAAIETSAVAEDKD